jgi:hypothetical protein
MVRQATKRNGTTGAPSTTSVPVNERDAALEFSAVIIPFSYGELASASKRGKEAAKKWKEGRSLPSAWSMLNMARDIPAVRAWMMAKLGDTPHMQFNSAQGIDVLARAMQSLAHLPGPDGDAIRALMQGAQIKPGGRA